jgi:hypothetical protein
MPRRSASAAARIKSNTFLRRAAISSPPAQQKVSIIFVGATV